MAAQAQATKAWIEDVAQLWKRPAEFVPTARMSTNERLNAYVRFVVYVTCATYVWNRQAATLGIGLVLVALVTLVHPRDRYDGHDGHWTGMFVPPSEMNETNDTRVEYFETDTAPCRRSTPENPFANFLLYDPPNAGPACSYDEHRDDIRTNFNRTLFRDVEDIYENQNSQRQFTTMPVTQNIPDTRAFADFLAGPRAGRPSCKEDPKECRGFFP